MYHLIKPALFRLDAERAHELVTSLLRTVAARPLAARVIRRLYAYDDPILATRCAGLRFANPLGLAAGFDKCGDLARPLALLGFGHVEVGTVTPLAQPGNPLPRLFRLPADEALINRMGFNSPGMAAVARELRDHRPPAAGHRPPMTERGSDRLAVAGRPSSFVLGVNIGKNRDTPLELAAEDYAAAFSVLAPLADYVTVNISSPNTPGLRRLHGRAALAELLGALAAHNRALPQPRPVFLKLSPDEPCDTIAEVVEAGVAAGCAGFVAVNTTLGREGVRGRAAREAGGLSGRPLAARARDTVALVHGLTGGALPVIGVGGVANAADAYELIRAGASLVQLYTGLVYQGPAVARRIKRGLAALLRRDGFRSVADAVGAAGRA